MINTRSMSGRAIVVGILASALTLTTGPSAGADPIPGFTFDSTKLEASMTACMARELDGSQILMGWVDARTGDVRQWRCSSLQHMLGPEERDGEGHDPFADVESFMHCVDRVVTYGFPRKASNPRYKVNIFQYHGTKKRANVVFNPETGDIVTIYTQPDDDWAECATWSP